MKTKILVASKGRAGNAKFLEMVNLREMDNVIAVVEPQEEHLYRAAYPALNFLVLPDNDRGLAFARNAIKKYSEEQLLTTVWIIDDDINGFYYREGTRLYKTDFTDALQKAEQQFLHAGIAFGGLDLRQYAWSASKPLLENTFVDGTHFVDNLKMKGLRYDERLKLKVDRDMAIKVIKAGHKTGRTTLFAWSHPALGSIKGGLKEAVYDRPEVEEAACDMMVEIWGEDVCQKIVKKNGRHDVKIAWDNINKIKQGSLF